MDKPHKNLIAWQLAMDIAEEIYSITWTALSSMLIEEDKIISGLIRSQKKAG
jgi:hypothetical protein